MAILRIPKPKSFLHFVSLRSATELIIFILLVNKVSGLYGILALFTGFELNTLQLSHYIYNLLTFGLAAWLASAVRKPQEPLKALGLAWTYVLDTLINTVYTAFFIASWFAVLAQHLGQDPGIAVPGAGTIDDTSGFTSPEIDASHVAVDAKPSGGLIAGQEATLYASNTGEQSPTLLQSGSLASLVIICVFILVRVYFCLVVMSHSRNSIRQYILMSTNTYAQSDDPTLAENPFREGREEGQGFRGRLGRFMLTYPSKTYWLGRDDSDVAWERSAAEKLGQRRSLRVRVPTSRRENGPGVKKLEG